MKQLRQFEFGQGFSVTSAPASEPLTATVVKNWLKVDFTTDDTLITSLIQAAREVVEEYTGLKLFTQTVAEKWDEWPAGDDLYNRFSGLSLSCFPVQSITSITYVDGAGSSQTLSSTLYDTDLVSRPCRIAPDYDDTWPTTLLEMNAITVTYVAGYAATTDIPEAIKTAMLLMIAQWYDNRTDSVRKMPMASESLLRPYKLMVHVSA